MSTMACSQVKRADALNITQLNIRHLTGSPSTIASSRVSSDDASWRHSSGSSATEFEDIDSTHDTSSELVPLKLSDSVKKLLTRSNAKYVACFRSSLGFPTTTTTKLLVVPRTTPSNTKRHTAVLAVQASFNAGCTKDMDQVDLPSRDGSALFENNFIETGPPKPSPHPSISGDRLTMLSERVMDVTMQLQSNVMDALLQTPRESQHSNWDEVGKAIVPPAAKLQGLNIDICSVRDPGSEAHEPVTPSSVPSPGTFFASLKNDSQQLWTSSLAQRKQIDSANSIAGKDTLTSAASHADSQPADVEPDASKYAAAHEDTVESNNLCRVDAESREKRAGASELAKQDRIRHWLLAQQEYLYSLLYPYSAEVMSLETSPSIAAVSIPSEASHPKPVLRLKKSVRFAELDSASTTADRAESDALLYHAFEHLINQAHPSDPFIYAMARAEALQAQRYHLRDEYSRLLQCRFVVHASQPVETTLSLRMNSTMTSAATAHGKAMAQPRNVHNISRQLQPQIWKLEATRFLNGGNFLTAAARDIVNSRMQHGSKPRILDISSQHIAGWGWAVALSQRDADIYTVVPQIFGNCTLTRDWTAHREPPNHHTITVANLWTLPFPDGSFDVISARTLHSILRRPVPKNRHEESNSSVNVASEWDLTLRELHRLLTPNGLFQFSVLSPKATAPLESKLTSLSSNFIRDLISLGYDAFPEKTLLSSITAAGFVRTEKAWTMLPLRGHSKQSGGTRIEAMTEMVGSRDWEDWLLKVRLEMGWKEERLLEGFAEAVGEMVGAVRNDDDGEGRVVGWRMLSGYARKGL